MECRSLRLLHVKDLDVGARRNLQTGALQRTGGFHLLHVAALAALEGVHMCQLTVLMQDAQHRWCDAPRAFRVATLLLPAVDGTLHHLSSPPSVVATCTACKLLVELWEEALRMHRRCCAAAEAHTRLPAVRESRPVCRSRW